ncbi:ABC-type multidrug transport system ATPase and permease components-like protein [Parafrankia sp. EAN1pec]|uniref:ABC transporter ATP-binding protein n=1 Tax=Parafrankia sp. (strain EAN1pec) TaxID=298653 RepID=UPI0000543CA9|nr:ABC-type multidrug transport system ATPase and permease components-like protein [Frankia sp. EAN1pec]
MPLKQAPIVLLDEATATLDPADEYLIRRSVTELKRTSTVIVVAHTAALIDAADQVVVLDGGRVVERGGPSELRAAGAFFSLLWGDRVRSSGWRLGGRPGHGFPGSPASATVFPQTKIMFVVTRGVPSIAPNKIIFWMLIGALSTAGCSALPVSWPEAGCTDRDNELAARLNNLAVLDLHPAGATVQEQGSGCSESSGATYAGRTYRPAGTTDGVMEFYHRTVPAAGWKLEHVDNRPVDPGEPMYLGSSRCYSKSTEGSTVFLTIWFPDDSGEDGNDPPGPGIRHFRLDVTADRDGISTC